MIVFFSYNVPIVFLRIVHGLPENPLTPFKAKAIEHLLGSYRENGKLKEHIAFWGLGWSTGPFLATTSKTGKAKSPVEILTFAHD